MMIQKGDTSICAQCRDVKKLSPEYGESLFQHLFSLRSCLKKKKKSQIHNVGSGLNQNIHDFFTKHRASFPSQTELFFF